MARFMLRQRYLVTLKNGEAFSGVIEKMTKEHVVLQQVTSWTRDGQSKVDGQLIIERRETLYYQKATVTENASF